MGQNDAINQMCFNSTVPNIGLTTALLFIELLPEFGPKSQSMTKHRKFRATNLRQKVRTFCHNLNRDKMAYLFKYTLTVQFSI